MGCVEQALINTELWFAKTSWKWDEEAIGSGDYA